jgi:hypothetical protein
MNLNQQVHPHYREKNYQILNKELFMVLDIENPQFNFQNEASNSQLLIVGK